MDSRYNVLQAIGEEPEVANVFRDLKANASVATAPVKIPSQPAAPSTDKVPKKSRANCAYCEGYHLTGMCVDLKKLDVGKRVEFIKEKRLCWKCLGTHKLKDCYSKFSCAICKGAHHTILHEKDQASMCGEVSCLSGEVGLRNRLGIATVRIDGIEKKNVEFKALLDTGSNMTLISKKAAQRLGLPVSFSSISINGIGGTQKAQGMTKVAIKPHFKDEVVVTTKCLIVSSLPIRATSGCAQLPLEWENMQMAEKGEDSGPVDLVLGVEVFQEIVSGEVLRKPGFPMALGSKLGFFVMGSMAGKGSQEVISLVNNASAEDMVKAIFQQEGVDNRKGSTIEGELAEKHFLDTTVFKDGKYTVKLPFNGKESSLGDSMGKAMAIFKSWENKMQDESNGRDYVAYKEIIFEEIRLGRLREMSEEEVRKEPGYYVSHHAVKIPISHYEWCTIFQCEQRARTAKSL